MQVTVYTLMSCNASQDFVYFLRYGNFNHRVHRVYDSKYPNVEYDVTLDELEQRYNRRFHTLPIIFIDGRYYPSISAAKEKLNA